jgi:regulator of sigma E protease
LGVIYSVIGFVLAIGILVAVHEFGHFWVARKLGVKVLTFSIGFGKPIWRKVAGPDQVEYVIAQIPLGGYVKMLGQGTPDEPIDPADAHRAFDSQPVWKRALIVAAGPGINFLFAIILFMFIGMQSVTVPVATFGDIPAGSMLSEAGVKEGDTLVSVDGKKADYLFEHDLYFFNQVLKRDDVSIKVRSGGKEFDALLATSDLPIYRISPEGLMRSLGFIGVRPDVTTEIANVSPGSAASDAGLQKGDIFAEIDGVAINEWSDLTNAIRPNADKELQVVVQRDGQNVSYAITPTSRTVGDQTFGLLGVGPKIMPLPEDQKVVIDRSVFQALTYGAEQTWLMSTLSLRMLGKMITLQVSYKNVNGPLMIASVAGDAIQISFTYYLYFLALISISLGVMNLLPVPMLDGGHLASYVIEIVAGKPFAERVFMAVQPLGLLMLGSLMCLAFYNDILKLIN